MKYVATLLLASTLALAGCGALRHGEDPLDEPQYPDTAAATVANGAIYQGGHDIPLFENPVARNVGDIVTIHLIESTNAQKSATTTTKKATAATLPGPTIGGRPITINGTEILKAGMDNSQKFDGQGASTQSNNLSGDVTVTIVRRLANGNLVIRGDKWITLNQGREFIRVSGVVRPIDIAPDNTILSSKVGNAQITYSGKGTLADANAPGWLARFFSSPKLPF